MSTALRMSPLAYLQWNTWLHAGDTEVGAFGVHAKDDPLLVDWLWLPPQECNAAFTQTDPGSWEDFLTDPDVRADLPGEVTPVWLHTHPGSSATPSGYDEDIFAKEFGTERLAVFAIKARRGETYGRVQVGGSKPFGFEVDVEVFWSWLPKYADRIALFFAGWEAEFKAKVREKKWVVKSVVTAADGKVVKLADWDAIGLAKRTAVAQQGTASLPGKPDAPARAPVISLLDDGDDDLDPPAPDFEDWLKATHEVSSNQLDAACLEGLKEEYFEEFGVHPDEDLDGNCETCQWPLGEGEDVLCTWCRSDRERFDVEDLVDASGNDVLDDDDDNWRGYVG